MLPLKDKNPTSSRSIVMPILIAVNIVVFFFVQPFSIGTTTQAKQDEQAIFFICHSAIPAEVSHQQTLIDQASPPAGEDAQLDREVERRFCPSKSVWASIFYTMFLHGSLLHIGGNMLFLWVFGDNIEDRLGKVKFLLLYLISGIAATFVQTLVGPSSGGPLIGASGAIAGVLGAYIVLFPRARVRTLVFVFLIFVVDIPAIVLLGIWFAMQLLQGVGPGAAGGGVAYMAHVGGFVAGILLLLLFRPRRTAPPPYVSPY
ncbi:MAG: rhomboid family intramembrane serine protease [Actinomycetota bacterium]